MSVVTATTTGVTSSLNPSSYDMSVTFAATAIRFLMAGQFSLWIPAQPWAARLAIDTSTGQATYTTSTLTAGTHSITAVYSGDSAYAGSISDNLDQVVQPAASVTVNKPGWIDTGIDLQAGDQVQITASGTIKTDDFSASPDGSGVDQSYSGNTIDSNTYFSLIGCIGSSNQGNNDFEVGNSHDFTVKSPGRLYLAANDIDYNSYDNGFWNVNLAVQPAAPAKTTTTQLSVPGNVAWTDSGVDVQAGDQVLITASQYIYAGYAGYVGPEGSEYTYTPDVLDANWPYVSLIGNIGAAAGRRFQF